MSDFTLLRFRGTAIGGRVIAIIPLRCASAEALSASIASRAPPATNSARARTKDRAERYYLMASQTVPAFDEAEIADES